MYKSLSEALHTIHCLPMLVAVEQFGTHYIKIENGIYRFRDITTGNELRPDLTVSLKYDIITERKLEEYVKNNNADNI